MTVVLIDRHDGIAVVVIDNPPVNALVGRGSRPAVVRALAETEADPGVRAVVLACAGRTFIAGPDITEFGKPPVEGGIFPTSFSRSSSATWLLGRL